ncbi:MAG TPA: protein phosphatase 2C domain-containing protein, partial [Abditibacteriaceae bacterium]
AADTPSAAPTPTPTPDSAIPDFAPPPTAAPDATSPQAPAFEATAPDTTAPNAPSAEAPLVDAATSAATLEAASPATTQETPAASETVMLEGAVAESASNEMAFEAPAPGASIETPGSVSPAQPAPAAAPSFAPVGETEAPVVDTPAASTPVPSSPVANAPIPADTPPTAPPTLPGPAAQEPPRPLVPGAFLRQEFEIKAVLSRGMTNLYQAQGGDYGDSVAKLIAERDIVVESASSPAAANPSAPSSETSTEESDANLVSASGAVESAEEAATTAPVESTTENGEDSAVLSADENTELTSPLFPPHEEFEQEDRQYRVFDFFESVALQDYREPTNDIRLLAMLHSLAKGLEELDSRGLSAELTTDTLRVDENGELKFLGFTSPKTASSPNPVAQLSAMTTFLLKHVFAESSTMRLDDRFAGLALSEEVKSLARGLDSDPATNYANIGEAVAAITALYPAKTLRAHSALLSDVGQERELNEDAGMIVKIQRAAHLGSREMELYVVSDGMGGHEGGEVASDLTMTSLQRHLDELSDIDWNDNVAVRAALYDVIDAVNNDVVALTETPRYRGTRAKPGATLTFALRLGARVFLGNVGDSRAYKINAQGLQRVSKDHSYVQSLIDRGELTEETAWDHPEGSIITAHIGYAKLKLRDVFLRLVTPGDKLLLVSDGVTDMLRDREYEPHIQGDDPQLIVQRLVDASNAAGGADNITALCVVFS